MSPCMMSADEVVDTSDPDEREVLNAYHPSYWQQFAHHPSVVSASPTSIGVTGSSPVSTQPSSPTSGARASSLNRTPITVSPGFPPGRSKFCIDVVDSAEDIQTVSSVQLLTSTQHSPSPRSGSPILSREPSPVSKIPLGLLPLPATLPRLPTLTRADANYDAYVQATPKSRYALRARNAKQLNPYVYDQLLYKKQMQSNPEAIVKIVSSRGHSSRLFREQFVDSPYSGEWMSHQREPKPANKERWYPKYLDDESSSDGHQKDNYEDLRSGAQLLEKQKVVRAAGKRRSGGSSSPISAGHVSFRGRNFSDSESLPAVDADQKFTNGMDSEDVPQDDWSDGSLPPRTSLSAESQSFALHGSGSTSSASGNDSAEAILSDRSPTLLGRTAWDSLRRSRDKQKNKFTGHLDLNDSGDDDPSATGSSSAWDIQGLKELKKVWPAVMVKRYLKQLENDPVARKRQVHQDDGKQDEAVKPGETRIRYSTRPLPQTRIVKGDSDSSSDTSSDISAHNGRQSVDHGERFAVSPRAPHHRVRQKKWNNADTVHLNGLESSDDSNLITSLSHHHHGSASVTSKSDRKVHSVRINADSNSMVGNPIRRSHQSERRTKQRRSICDRDINFHTFTASGRRLPSLRRKNVSFKVDLEDDEFHRALAPLTNVFHGNHSSPFRSISGSSNISLGGTAPNLSPISRVDQQGGDFRLPRKIEVMQDLGVSFLPSGITFGPDTYLGKGWLHELITVLSRPSELTIPAAFSAPRIAFSPDMSFSTFSFAFTMVCDGLLDVLKAQRTNGPLQSLTQWDDTMHVVCQFTSWLPQKLSHEDLTKMQTLVCDQRLRLLTSLSDCGDSSDVIMALHWFVIEVSARFQNACRNRDRHFPPFENRVLEPVTQVVSLLFKNIHNIVQYVQQLRAHDADDPISHRPAEIWINLLHLLEACDVGLLKSSVHPFWLVLQKSIQNGHLAAQSGLQASEAMWQAIFCVCALSQFSLHGMSTSTCRIGPFWQLVVQALSTVRLTDEPVSETALSQRNLRKRDDYVRMVAARCLILVDRWRWNLDYSTDMFNELAEIFRSRSFGNLRGEPSDFPAFMLRGEPGLLFRHTSSDSAFELFVKLIVRTSHTSIQDMNERKPASAKSKKLLSLAVPVGSVSFTSSSIATNHELSMLYNRFTALAIAIYLDPTPSNVHVRLAQARRYVIYKEAQTNVRNVCIRAAMYLAILLRRCHTSIEPALDWFADMTLMLVNEHSSNEKNRIADNSAKNDHSRTTRNDSCLQFLLASLRYLLDVCRTSDIQETQGLFLSIIMGPWITHVFTPGSSFTSAVKVRNNMRRLLQVLLDTWEASGDKDLGQPQSPDGAPALRRSPVNSEFVEGILGSNTALWEIVEKHIIPTIYHIVGKFSDDSSQHNLDDASQWIDCWVRYANFLVQYQRQDWSQFLQLGPQSWEKIIDPSWRRWVGLRFMCKVLHVDPGAYSKYQQTFMQILLESLVTPKVTLELKYMTLMLNADGFQHPLLENLLAALPLLSNGCVISISQFLESRPIFIQVMLENLNRSLGDENDCHVSLIAQNQVNLRLFISMFVAMEDYCKSFTGDIERQYMSLCLFICSSLLKQANMVSQSVLAKWVVWAKALCKTGYG